MFIFKLIWLQYMDWKYFELDLFIKISFSIFRTQKENLKQIEAQEEQRLLRGQKDYLEIEVRKFKRKKILSLHLFEQELLREVSKNIEAK